MKYGDRVSERQNDPRIKLGEKQRKREIIAACKGYISSYKKSDAHSNEDQQDKHLEVNRKKRAEAHLL